MKRTVRHTLRVLSLAAASALLLAGCSGGGDASEGGDSAGSVTLKIWGPVYQPAGIFPVGQGGI